MKKTISILLMLCMMLSGSSFAWAEKPLQNAVCELYSADGAYVDDVGNKETYSYRIPQISDSSADAEEINAEIAEEFGKLVESQFRYMEGGFSLSSCQTEWKAFWNGTQLFLLVIAYEIGDITVHGVYGYDFETGTRITNRMILEQKGISEEAYLEALRETVQLKFDDMLGYLLSDPQKIDIYNDMLEKTMSRLNMEQPMFLNQYGEIETVVEIVSLAGAGIYEHLVTPFSGRDDSDRTYRIRLVGDLYLVESCPEFAKEGETVTVLTYDVTDGDKAISVDGADGTEINWFEYQFVMPDHDVEVSVEFIDYGLA